MAQRLSDIPSSTGVAFRNPRENRAVETAVRQWNRDVAAHRKTMFSERKRQVRFIRRKQLHESQRDHPLRLSPNERQHADYDARRQLHVHHLQRIIGDGDHARQSKQRLRRRKRSMDHQRPLASVSQALTTGTMMPPLCHVLA